MSQRTKIYVSIGERQYKHVSNTISTTAYGHKKIF